MTAPAHETPIPGAAAGFAAKLRAQLPVLETPRLRLRAAQLQDFATYAEIATAPRGRHLLEGGDRTDAWLDFAQMTATWLLRGHGLWAVETRADDMLIGFVVLGFEPGDNEPELGFMLRTHAEGQGFAAEAAGAARDYAWRTAKLPALVSTIDPDNTRSCRLAERLGAVRDAEAEAAYADDPILVYRHARPELRP